MSGSAGKKENMHQRGYYVGIRLNKRLYSSTEFALKDCFNNEESTVLFCSFFRIVPLVSAAPNGRMGIIRDCAIFLILSRLLHLFSGLSDASSPSNVSVQSFVPSARTPYYRSQWREYRTVKVRD